MVTEVVIVKKNKTGFTLVEMVVVIAIIGVISALLVPTMMNYIKKGKLKKANINAKVLFNQMNTAVTDMLNNGQQNQINSCTQPVNCAQDDPSDVLRHTIYCAMKGNGSSVGYAFWKTGINDSTEIKFVQWCENENPSANDIIGQYPSPANSIDELPAGTFQWGTLF